MANMQGKVKLGGEIALELNPPAPPKDVDVNFDRSWVRAELDEGELSVKVIGQASYLGRTVTHTVDLSDELAPLQALLQQILDAYTPTAKQRTLEAAYEAYGVAVRKGESKE